VRQKSCDNCWLSGITPFDCMKLRRKVSSDLARLNLPGDDELLHRKTAEQCRAWQVCDPSAHR
jgi:hypothetical protein